MYRLYLLLSGCRYGHWLSHFPLCLIKIHIQTPRHPDPAASRWEENGMGNVAIPFPQLLPQHPQPQLTFATRDAYDADNMIQQTNNKCTNGSVNSFEIIR